MQHRLPPSASAYRGPGREIDARPAKTKLSKSQPHTSPHSILARAAHSDKQIPPPKKRAPISAASGSRTSHLRQPAPPNLENSRRRISENGGPFSRTSQQRPADQSLDQANGGLHAEDRTGPRIAPRLRAPRVAASRDQRTVAMEASLVALAFAAAFTEEFRALAARCSTEEDSIFAPGSICTT